MTDTNEAAMADLLYRMALDPDSVAPSELAQADWNWIETRARAHRLLPLLYTSGLPCPEDLTERLNLAYRKATMRQLRIGGDLVQISQLLTDHGIPHLFLKGAVLAHHWYPEPALRPMRDIDVLVPLDKVQKAHAALRARAGRPIPRYAHLDTETELTGKHLPPVWSPSRKIAVEVHGQLWGPGDPARDAGVKAFTRALWERAESFSLGTVNLPSPSWQDLLSHVILHGVYDHEFNIGPVFIRDLRVLLTAQAGADWPAFWDQMRQMQAERGAVLALRLAGLQATHPAFALVPRAMLEEVTTPVLANARALMVQDMSTRHEALIAADLAGQTAHGLLGYLAHRAFPTRQRIATRRAVAGLPAVLPGGYLGGWLWFVAHRGAAFLRAQSAVRASQQVHHLSELRRWLKQV